MRRVERLLRIVLLAVAGALAAAVVIWVAGPQGTGYRLPAEVVKLDLADVLATDPDASMLPQRAATFERLVTARITLRADGVPLADALAGWADAAGLSVMVSSRGLDLEGLDPDEPVFLHVQDAPAGEVLTQLLQNFVDWEVGPSGVVHVPATGYSEDAEFLRVYDVTDLLLQAGQHSRSFAPEKVGPESSPGLPVDATPAEAYNRGYASGRRERSPAGTQRAAVADLIAALPFGDGGGYRQGHGVQHFAGRLAVRATAEQHVSVAETLAALRAARPEGR